MSGIAFGSTGNFHSTLLSLKILLHRDPISIMKKYGQIGVEALANATPKRTGKTAASWYYVIERVPKGFEITWRNSNKSEQYYVASLIQYGHGTKSGYWVEGRDYINPVMRPIFDRLSQELRG